MIEDTYKRFKLAVKNMENNVFSKLLFTPGLLKLSVRFFTRVFKKNKILNVKLFFGQRMNIVLPEIISEVIHSYGYFDAEVTEMAIKNTSKGDVILDIGAHFGYFSLLFSHMVGERGKVLSFEPTPSTYNILKSNVSGVSNIQVFNLAVGDKNDKCTISDYGLKYCAWNTIKDKPRMDMSNEIEVKKVSVGMIYIDNFIEEKGIQPTMIKIDAEGFEYEIIKGLKNTIQNYKPKLIIETGSTGSLLAAQELLSSGYTAYIMKKSGELVALSGEIEDGNRKYKDMLFKIHK